MELNRNNLKKLMLVVTFGIVLFWVLQNFKIVFRLVQMGLGLLMPFLVGGCIAFILNVLLRLVENKLFRPLNERGYPLWMKCRRPVSLIVSLGIVIGVLFILMFLIVPEIRRTVLILKDSLPVYMEQLQQWSMHIVERLNIPQENIPEIAIDWNKAWAAAMEFLRKGSAAFVSTTVGITSTIFSGVFNFTLGLVFSIYLLLQKEKLCSQVKRLIYAALSRDKAQGLLEVCVISNRVFSKFVSGQFTEAVIIGLLCFLGMTIFSMPYATMIAALVGFTALIPVFGAFIGTGVGAFLILMVNPIKALWFIVFIIVLQQLEGNIIYPKVVGKSVGLPGIWVLAAVTIGGSTLGVVGMLVSVPVSSVIYCLLKMAVSRKLAEKGIDPHTL